MTIRLSSAPSRGGRLADGVGDLALSGAGDLDEQPALAARQLRHRPAVRAYDVDDAGVETLAGRGLEVEQRRYVVGGLGHRAITEHEHQPIRRILDEAHRGRRQRRQRALGAGHERGDIEAALGQQVLKAVARHLPTERAELRTDGAELLRDDVLAAGQASASVAWSAPSVSRSPAIVTASSATTLSEVRP